MAYGKSLTSHGRKHGDNLGYLDPWWENRAVVRYHRHISNNYPEFFEPNFPEKYAAQALKWMPRHIVQNAKIVLGI